MSTEHEDLTENIPKAWMIRKCYCYHDEYKACTMIKTKIHDIFTHGEVQSCQDWKDNFSDCKSWVSNRDIGAAKRLIAREEKRIADRLMPHHLNDVWERRTSPPSPEEWTPALPSYLQKNVDESIIDYEESMEATFGVKLKSLAATGLNCSIM
ncbi:UPF0545 protein C22orf39 -like protein [Caligus rogercresseyi]|nr:UPF0545 protein C22orf39 -like protein [Caligus rogercresseyi]